MVPGVDYSFSRPDIAQLWSLGYRFVCRYLSWLPNGKVINKAELAALINKGFSVALNWEFQARDAVRGAAGGTTDATEAVRQAAALGYPKGCTIYYSAGDFDVTGEGKLATCVAYVKAAAAKTRSAGYRMGVYGGYHFLNELWKAGVIDDGWQSPSSFGHPGFRWDTRNTVHQKRLGVKLAGGDVDTDEANGKTYFHSKTTVPPVVAPAPVVSLASPADFAYPYQVILEIAKMAPVKLPVTSTVRVLGSADSPVWDYHVGKAAVDFGSGWPSRLTKAQEQGLGAWWLRNATYLTELIHTTVYSDDNGYYVKNGRVNPGAYSTSTKLAHRNHYHIAIATVATAVNLLNKLLKESKTHVYIKGVGVATIQDIAKAVWEYGLPDPVHENRADKAGNLLRYARIDAFRPTTTWLAAVTNAVKALLTPPTPPPPTG